MAQYKYFCISLSKKIIEYIVNSDDVNLKSVACNNLYFSIYILTIKVVTMSINHFVDWLCVYMEFGCVQFFPYHKYNVVVVEERKKGFYDFSNFISQSPEKW